jgi:hypothetical protein
VNERQKSVNNLFLLKVEPGTGTNAFGGLKVKGSDALFIEETGGQERGVKESMMVNVGVSVG